MFVALGILIVSGISLLFPGTILDKIWVLNEPAYRQLLPFHRIVGGGFLALGLVSLFAGIGLLSGRKWGWWLVVIGFAANGMGDAVRFVTGDFLGGSIGLVVVAILLVYLTRPKVKGFFKE